ncbi:transposase [Parapedobacter deserti]|uniref:Transposase n=1 Tax=Parapedobacter deserti TaxID=1912957 RepID=A0ABV7JLT2_9SPHI
MKRYRQGKKVSGNGCVSQISYYRAKRCGGCPLLGMCHKSREDRIIMINHRLNELRNKARELLTSERGLMHRSKRPIEPEAAFGQLKGNNNFNRFTLKGLVGVGIEFALMAIGHNLRKMAAKAKNSENNGPDNPCSPSPLRLCHLCPNHYSRIGKAA